MSGFGVFFVVAQIFVTKKCSLMVAFRQQLHLISDICMPMLLPLSSLFPLLGTHMRSQLQRSVTLGRGVIYVEQGVREMQQKCHKGQGGTGMVTEPRDEQEMRHSVAGSFG